MGNQQSITYSTTSSLAATLAAKDKPTLLAFLSPNCGLCKSLLPDLDQAEQGGGVQVARLNASDIGSWAPELLAYDIKATPSFVLLDKSGFAVCKSSAAFTKPSMQDALKEMLQVAQNK